MSAKQSKALNSLKVHYFDLL